jgi:major structural subunit of bundle-forming pilus
MKSLSLQSIADKRKALFSKRREEGLTLIEASMVLALSAVVVAGVMLYYQSASDNNRLQSALGELGGIQTAIQTLYSGTSNYTNLTYSVLTGNSSIPPSYQTLTGGVLTGLTNPWGGKVDLSVPTVTPAGSEYQLEFEGVPQSACTPFASQQLGSQMISVAINAATAHTSAPTPDVAAGECNISTSAGNSITWILH